MMGCAHNCYVNGRGGGGGALLLENRRTLRSAILSARSHSVLEHMFAFLS